MSEDIREIERLIKQSAEFGDSLSRLVRKLQEQNRRKTQPNRQQAEDLGALHAKLTDLRSYIDVATREVGPQQHHNLDEAYAKARVEVVHGTATSESRSAKPLKQLLRLAMMSSARSDLLSRVRNSNKRITS